MRKLLVTVLVLLGLLVAADRVAEQVTERVLADQLHDELGVRPSVEVGGFPFLTQAVAGRYDDLHVSADRVEQAGLTLQDFTATLHGAHVPLSDALHLSVTTVPVDRLTASALVSYDTLSSLGGTRGLRLSADPAGARVSGTFRVLGEDVPVTAVSTVRLDGDTLVLTARQLEVGGATPSGSVAGALSGRLDLRLRLPELPFDVQLSAVQPGPQGVTVTGSATDVVLRR